MWHKRLIFMTIIQLTLPCHASDTTHGQCIRHTFENIYGRKIYEKNIIKEDVLQKNVNHLSFSLLWVVLLYRQINELIHALFCWIFVVFISLIVLSRLCMWFFLSITCIFEKNMDRGWNATENNQSHLLPCVHVPKNCETMDNKFVYKTFVFLCVIWTSWFDAFHIKFMKKTIWRIFVCPRASPKRWMKEKSKLRSCDKI